MNRYVNLLIVLIHLAHICWSNDDLVPNWAKERGYNIKFDYVRTEPANELGIFTKVIAQIHRKANQTIEEWRINRNFLPSDAFESLVERCNADDEEGGHIRWKGCVSDKEGLLAYVKWGVPEPKNKTVTYLEIQFKPFSKVNKKGEEETCVLEEVYKAKAYVVLNTFSEMPSNDSFPRGVVDSVAAVHQHQLDSFGENFLSIFEDKIELDKIYDFGVDEYYDRDPPYECFLSIACSESKTVIEEKCDFFCPSTSNISFEQMQKLLEKAREVADAQAQDEDDYDIGLTNKRHEEL